jgi:hypothetical protein
MDTVFWICVEILKVSANFLGISYQALNVWIFVIAHPLITLYLFCLYIKYKKISTRLN